MSRAEAAEPDGPNLDSLRPGSLIRRALFGLFVMFLGTFGAAWLFHSSINSSTVTAPQLKPSIVDQATGNTGRPYTTVQAK